MLCYTSTFLFTGGYYTIEQKVKKLRLILLNTNLWVTNSGEDDPGNQWSWLEEVLKKSHLNKETVVYFSS